MDLIIKLHFKNRKIILRYIWEDKQPNTDDNFLDDFVIL